MDKSSGMISVNLIREKILLTFYFSFHYILYPGRSAITTQIREKTLFLF